MNGVQQPASPQWESALAVYADGQAAAGYNRATTSMRVIRIRVLARAIKINPWQVTWETYRAHLDALKVADSTRASYRAAMRSFYRWALRTRRIDQDPTDEPSLRAEQLRASPAWEAEILPWTRYLRALGRSDRSVAVRRSQMRHLARTVPHLAPYAVTTDDLLDLLASFRWEPETRHAHMSAARSFYSWARSVKRTKHNPAKRLPPVRMSVKVVEPATEQDLRSALAKADPRERLAIELGAQVGLRCGEVTRIRMRDITGEPGNWWLLVHGKGSKQRRVPLSDTLAGAVRARGDDWAFPGNYDGHISSQYLGKRISELLPPGVTMHKLRHRFATQAYAVDRDVFTLQLLLGHSSPATTRRYVRTPDHDLRRLVDAVAGPQRT